MRCRRIITDTDKKKKVVWFGSYGKNEDGTAKFYDNTKHNNFSDKQEGVADSLTQRLSVIKGELWYNISYGLPLFEKQKSKVAIDSFIGSTITTHPDVTSIESFKSQVIDKNYTCTIVINTVYGQINLEI